MISLSVQHDFAALDRDLARIADTRKRERATAQALNKVGAKARTTARQLIRRYYNLPGSEVQSRVVMQRASRDALAVVIEPLPGSTKGRSKNVVHFLQLARLEQALKAKRTGKLAKVKTGKAGRRRVYPILRFKILRSGGQRTIRGAFLGNKGRTVFRRIGRGRLPIESVQTIDVTQMFAARKVVDPVVARIRAELPVEVERAIRLAMGSGQ